jgi:hypothetical protein
MLKVHKLPVFMKEEVEAMAVRAWAMIWLYG